MNGILWASFLSSAASYLSSCGLFIARARRKPALHLSPATPLRLLELGAVLHLVYLVCASVMDRRCPVFSLHSALGIVSLVGVVTYAVISRGRRLEALGGSVAALAVLFLAAAHAIADRPAAANDRWLMAVHITSNLLAGGILLVAASASAFYLWSERRLRQRRALGQGPKLPPLESLDLVVHRLLWTAVPMLTIGLFTGRSVMMRAEGVNIGDHIRAVIAVGCWLLLVAVLLLRQWRGWCGRRPAYLVLVGGAGILLVIVSYIIRAMLGAHG